MANHRQQGPHVKRLICHRMAQLIIPRNGGMSDGVKAFANPGKLGAVARAATDWVFAAIDMVKQAPGSTWTDDEAVAAEIMRAVDARKAIHKH